MSFPSPKGQLLQIYKASDCSSLKQNSSSSLEQLLQQELPLETGVCCPFYCNWGNTQLSAGSPWALPGPSGGDVGAVLGLRPCSLGSALHGYGLFWSLNVRKVQLLTGPQVSCRWECLALVNKAAVLKEILGKRQMVVLSYEEWVGKEVGKAHHCTPVCLELSHLNWTLASAKQWFYSRDVVMIVLRRTV